jgi:hypothetical protein
MATQAGVRIKKLKRMGPSNFLSVDIKQPSDWIWLPAITQQVKLANTF